MSDVRNDRASLYSEPPLHGELGVNDSVVGVLDKKIANHGTILTLEIIEKIFL
jgi:hypothetical protein